MVIVAALAALFVWQGGEASEESTPPAPPSTSSTTKYPDILDLSTPPSVFNTLKKITLLFRPKKPGRFLIP